MPDLPCPFLTCEEVTSNDNKDLAIALFNAHVSTHNTGGAVASPHGERALYQPKS